MEGLIHSIESFGTVDGPGIRLVVFFKGCPMRCLYCHNPDTWTSEGAIKMTSEEILEQYDHNKNFYTNGGITATGGEPLVQIDFLIDLFKKAKAKGIHTCLDTSGITFTSNNVEKFDELIRYVDLVMLDIKHIDNLKHIELTSKPNENILSFAMYLDSHNITMYIRHVIVKGYTDDPIYLRKLGNFIGSLKNVKALDVLPYHDMAKSKYKELNIDYKLKDLKSLDKEDALKAKKEILSGIVETRNK
ncbi:MAG: pyruvate formate-lyase-activating protein [Bacilli bacterium]